MVPGKLATLGLLEIKVFWNKDYDSTISVHDATHKILWCDSNYIVDMVMWPKSGNCKFLWEKLSQPQFIRISPKKIIWGMLLVQVQ